MVPVLKRLNVGAACYGNHDLDYGEERLEELIKETSFPWLMANVHWRSDEQALAKTQPSMLMEWEGYKIGIIGLAEQEWLDTLSMVDSDALICTDFVSTGRKEAKKLRSQGADIIIALTHMRLPNDERLAREVFDIDLILGGHDHSYHTKEYSPTGAWLIKSGTDFQDFTEIEIALAPKKKKKKIELKHTRWRVTPELKIENDPVIEEVINKYSKDLESRLDEVIGRSTVELNCVFQYMRSQETILGNFLCDVIKLTADVDAVIMNSGTFRSDRTHGPGNLTQRDLSVILPFMKDIIVVLGLRGRQVIEALENGVGACPKLEGRFPQVSGLRFAYDPSLPPGSRIIRSSVEIGGRKLEEEEVYRVATKSFLALGKDGYNVFTEGTVIVDDEEGWVLPTMIRNFFIDGKKGDQKEGGGGGAPDVESTTPPPRSSCYGNTVRRRSLCLSPDIVLHQMIEATNLCSVQEGMVTISPKLEGRIRVVRDGVEAPLAGLPSRKGKLKR